MIESWFVLAASLSIAFFVLFLVYGGISVFDEYGMDDDDKKIIKFLFFGIFLSWIWPVTALAAVFYVSFRIFKDFFRKEAIG